MTPDVEMKYGERACAMCAQIYSNMEYGHHPARMPIRHHNVGGSRWGICPQCRRGDVDWEAKND